MKIRFAFAAVVGALALNACAPHEKQEKSVHFSFANEKAKAVFLAADFVNWNTSAIPMQRDRSGKWWVDVPLPPGRYEYKFFVDGRW